MKVTLKDLACLVLLSSLLSGCGAATNRNQALSNDPPKDASSPEIEVSSSGLEKKLAEIAKEANGRVGVFAQILDGKAKVGLNDKEHFALQSVVKVPIAMAVMKLVTDGKLKLDDKIKIEKAELVPANMHSPIRDANPDGTTMTVQDLLLDALSVSDGTAADVLQRVAGGAGGIQGYVDSLGIVNMKVKYSHQEFSGVWDRQFDNWTTPRAAVDLLRVLVGENYCPKGADCKDMILMQMMRDSKNPSGRIVAGLPKGTPVAHKTGSGSTRDGIAAATNDIGIFTLPNGKHVAIAVFVRDAKADIATREAVIAKITRAIFDEWSKS